MLTSGSHAYLKLSKNLRFICEQAFCEQIPHKLLTIAQLTRKFRICSHAQAAHETRTARNLTIAVDYQLAGGARRIVGN